MMHLEVYFFPYDFKYLDVYNISRSRFLLLKTLLITSPGDSGGISLNTTSCQPGNHQGHWFKGRKSSHSGFGDGYRGLNRFPSPGRATDSPMEAQSTDSSPECIDCFHPRWRKWLYVLSALYYKIF
jgi:hypothetical protein